MADDAVSVPCPPNSQCAARSMPEDAVAMLQVNVKQSRSAQEEADVPQEHHISEKELSWTPPEGVNPETWKVEKNAASWRARWGWVKPKISSLKPKYMHTHADKWYHEDYPYRKDNSLEKLSYSNPQAAPVPGHPGVWSKKQKQEDIAFYKKHASIFKKERA